MVTRLPSSPLGDKVRTALGAAGLDTSHVGRAPVRMGLYFLESGAGLRPSSITYDRAGSVFASALEEARPFDRSGIALPLGPGGVALAQAPVTAAHSAGVPICFGAVGGRPLFHTSLQIGTMFQFPPIP